MLLIFQYTEDFTGIYFKPKSIGLFVDRKQTMLAFVWNTGYAGHSDYIFIVTEILM